MHARAEARILFQRGRRIDKVVIESLDGGLFGQPPGAPWLAEDPPDEWIDKAGS
jgi:hypothetical protein